MSGPTTSNSGPRSNRLVLAFAALTLIALFAAAVGISSSRDGSDSTGERPHDQPVQVELGEMYVKPSSIEWQRGKSLTLIVHNKGAMDHDLKVDGTTGTRMLRPGESEEVTFGPFESDADAWCTVEGHKEAGMSMHIHVSDAPSGPDVATDSGAVIDPNAVPTDSWNARDAVLAKAPTGKEHHITLTASEKVVEVAPGVRQEIWAFDGTIPGPTLRGKVGDTFVVTLRNEGKIAHSLDFHASKVAWNDEMRNIEPGESLEYRFEAKHAGAFMYHCGTAPALHHIGNGMYGALVIDPPDLAPVDHEFSFVQSELYTGAQDKAGSLRKMKTESWDAVVFNGYFNQYAFSPIRVEPGQRIRAWVIDVGPNENSAFHVIGTVFDTVFKEGAYQLRPDATRGGSQALDLQPSQGGFVEFTFDEAGKYPFVTHKFANAGKGAMGMFEVGAETNPAQTHPNHAH